MDTTLARRHAEASNVMLYEKAYRAGFDVKSTASYHTNMAILCLCDALEAAFRVKPEESLPEPGVYSTPEYGQYTSPYRHQTRTEESTAALLSISARELAKDVD